MSPAAFIERALSVPFRDHGSDWDGWSCWGLCRAWYREILGIDLPAHDVGYETAGETRQDRAAIGMMIEAGRVAWQSVDRPVMGDLLLLRCHARPIHVGVMVDRRRFLHAEKKIGTVIERLASPIWAKRIEGAYRYAGEDGSPRAAKPEDMQRRVPPCHDPSSGRRVANNTARNFSCEVAATLSGGDPMSASSATAKIVRAR